MSFNRKKNPYTLGNFSPSEELKKRRSLSEVRQVEDLRDPFERDPFKVQSYNFRYADPPTLPLQPPFFSYGNNTSDTLNTLHVRASNMQENSFRAERRRKYVQMANNSYHNEPTSRNYSSSGKIGICPEYAAPNYYQNNYAPISNHTAAVYGASINPYNNDIVGYNTYNNLATSSHTFQNTAPRIPTPTGRPVLQRKRSSLSLCEISIKIKRSEDNLKSDNVIINIATDKNGAISATTLPYKTDGLTIKSIPCNSKCGPTSPNKQQSLYTFNKNKRSSHSLNRSRSRSTSPDSESSSDYDTAGQRKFDRMPQFIALKQLSQKVQAENRAPTKSRTEVNAIPFTLPPWILGAKAPKTETTSKVEARRSTQTIYNNLNSNVADTRQRSNTSLRVTTLNVRSSQQHVKQSSTSLEHNCSVKASAVRVNEPQKRASSSTLRNTHSSHKSPLQVNISLYADKKPGLRV